MEYIHLYNMCGCTALHPYEWKVFSDTDYPEQHRGDNNSAIEDSIFLPQPRGIFCPHPQECWFLGVILCASHEGCEEWDLR